MSERITYQFGPSAIGATGDVFSVKGPKGKKGTLIDYGIQGITATFAGTTPASIAVGNASDPDAYGDEISLGTTAADTVGTVSARTLANNPAQMRSTYILDPDLPKDTAIYLTCVAASGGSPAGTAQPFMTIEWQD